MTRAAEARPLWLTEPSTRRHRLESGSLWVRPEPAEPAADRPDRGPAAADLDALCGYAARQNPRRGFLFVSKVLGRYLPACPARLDGLLAALAGRLPADLPGPVAFIGVAAAGIAIGHRVWARFLDRTGRDDTAFVASTRHRFAAPMAYAFDEPHSHAPRHRLYQPLDPVVRARLEAARTVVVVDDEVTSGRTFGGLVAAHHARFPAARHFVHAVLTSWADAPLQTLAPPGCAVHVIALACARYHFERDPAFAPQMPDVTGDAAPVTHAVTPEHARFGRATPATLAALDPPAIAPGERVLVLGTGELQYTPLLLAEHYAAAGIDVRFQCTTRAPVLPGVLIGSTLTFDDPWGEGMPNFLYNVAPGQYDRVILCQETPAAMAPRALVDGLGAEVLVFGRPR